MDTNDAYTQVADLARKAGISIGALCKRAGVARATVTRWKKRETQPSFRTWQKLVEAAKCSG